MVTHAVWKRVLLEIRNDGLRTPDAVYAWAERLYPWLLMR